MTKDAKELPYSFTEVRVQSIKYQPRVESFVQHLKDAGVSVEAIATMLMASSFALLGEKHGDEVLRKVVMATLPQPEGAQDSEAATLLTKTGAATMRVTVLRSDRDRNLTKIPSRDALMSGDMQHVEKAFRLVIESGELDPLAIAEVALILDPDGEHCVFFTDKADAVVASTIYCTDCKEHHLTVYPEGERPTGPREGFRTPAPPTLH